MITRHALQSGPSTAKSRQQNGSSWAVVIAVLAARWSNQAQNLSLSWTLIRVDLVILRRFRLKCLHIKFSICPTKRKTQARCICSEVWPRCSTTRRRTLKWTWLQRSGRSFQIGTSRTINLVSIYCLSSKTSLSWSFHQIKNQSFLIHKQTNSSNFTEASIET